MIIKDITQLGFLETHVVERNANNDLVFKKIIESQSDKQASVYIWILSSDLSDSAHIEIIYVGKAGMGVDVRFKQHQGGFKNSTTGRKNYEYLSQVLSEGKVIRVFSRKSDNTSLWDETVSLYSVEEDALCQKLTPLLNRAKFPNIEITGGKDNLTKHLVAPKNKFIEFHPSINDDIQEYINSLSQDGVDLLNRLIDFANTNFDECVIKLVHGYTDQPKGCNSVPMLVYGEELTNSGNKMKPNAWKIRISLTDEPRIVFPEKMLSLNHNPSRVDWGKSGSVSPKSTIDFLNNQREYIQL